MHHASIEIILAVILGTAAWHDVRAYRIPNWLVYGGLVVAVMVHLTSPLPGPALAAAAGGLWIGLIALLPAYAMGAAGAGDVKLLALVGGFTGPADAIGIAAMTYLTGAAMAGAYLGIARLPVLVGGTVRTVMPLPYSLAIAGGIAAWLILKVTH
jgi:prepilin peptidase CpaA